MSGYNIAIVSTGLPFNGNSLSTGSLGGSETGIVYLAREFVKAGHTVSVFSSCGPQAEGVFDGVIYFDISKWEPLGTFLNLDVLIVNRASQYLSQKCKAKAIYFYCQDATPENDQVHNQLWQTDRVVLLSPYHREIWESVEPRYGNHILEARNGVDLELIDKARKSVRRRSAVDDSKVNFIYASRPERGLKPLLEMWPLILQRIPHAFLTITTYNSQAIQVPENIQNIANWCYQTASQYPDSIKVLAKGLKKFDLYRLYLGCKALLYPCSFPEVSCGVGSTKIRIPGGCVEFKDVKAGDLVYGFDEKTKLISLGKVKWSRRTRKRAEVWKLSYGWKGGCQGAREDFVRFTPDHKFLMLDGTWTELKDLKPGDRLQPFYRHKSYGYAVTRRKNLSVYEHRLVMEYLLGRELASDDVVHHIDGNKYNNKPDNLQLVTPSEHMKIHEEQGRSSRVRKYKEYLRNLSPDQVTSMRADRSRAGKALWTGMTSEERASFVSRRASGRDLDKVSLSSRRSNLARWGSSPWRDESRLRDLYLNQGLSTVEIASLWGCADVTVSTWLSRLGIPKRTRSEAQFIKSENHQVISVVFDGYEDVYDMEVEGTHNFVANHIIAHNCISAIEAMATDTLVITTENYALVDTVAQDNGVLIPGRPQEEEYRTRFLSAVEKSVRTLEYQPRITRARAKIEGSYSWKSAAKIWLDDFNQLFQNRVTNKASGIVQTLYKNEDLVATREMTSQLKMGDQEQWAQIVLDRAIIADKLLINSPHHFPGKTSKGMAIRSVVSSFLSQHPEADTLLDLETGIGDTAAFLTKAFPQLSVTGLSIHAAHLQDAERTYFNDKDSPLLADDQARLTFAQSSSQTSADIVLAEKVLEYELDLTQCVKNIEDRVKNGGLCVVITREGPWSSDLEQLDVGYKSGRLHNFDGQDLTELLGHKQGFGSQCVVACHNNRGEVLSYWISYWVKSANSTVGEIDYSRKALTTRPYQGISLCMIVRDNEDHISQCLKSVLDVVDEFVIVNTGSTDTTMDIVRRLIPEERLVESSYAWDDDFSAARNYALSLCSQDWVLWLDSDEFLSGQKNLRKYLNSKIFPGFIIHQHHLTMDTELSPDTPVRLFKRGGIQWYGVVHEQVEQEMDASVRPALLLKDVNVVHLGYAIEEVRRDKYFNRNMALMYKDRKQNPDRRLGKMLLARDYRNLVNYRLEGLLKTGGGVTPETILLMREVCSIHHNNFLDHKDPLYETSFKLYQEILRIMIELNIPIKEGIEGSGIKTVSFPYKDLEGQTRVRKVYFLTGDEYFAYCGRLLRESNS